MVFETIYVHESHVWRNFLLMLGMEVTFSDALGDTLDSEIKSQSRCHQFASEYDAVLKVVTEGGISIERVNDFSSSVPDIEFDKTTGFNQKTRADLRKYFQELADFAIE